MPKTSKTKAAKAKKPKTTEAVAPPPDWADVSKSLMHYSDLYQRWRSKSITDVEYAKARGCFEPCGLTHPDERHFDPTDGFPPLVVTYMGESGVTHRRHDGSREMPSYIFAPGGMPVRVTDPYDKLSYVNKHLTNPEVWTVAFDGGRR